MANQQLQQQQQLPYENLPNLIAICDEGLNHMDAIWTASGRTLGFLITTLGLPLPAETFEELLPLQHQSEVESDLKIMKESVAALNIAFLGLQIHLEILRGRTDEQLGVAGLRIRALLEDPISHAIQLNTTFASHFITDLENALKLYEENASDVMIIELDTDGLNSVHIEAVNGISTFASAPLARSSITDYVIASEELDEMLNPLSLPDENDSEGDLGEESFNDDMDAAGMEEDDEGEEDHHDLFNDMDAAEEDDESEEDPDYEPPNSMDDDSAADE